MKTFDLVTIGVGMLVQVVTEVVTEKVALSISLAFLGGFFAYIGKEVAAKAVKRVFKKSDQEN